MKISVSIVVFFSCFIFIAPAVLLAIHDNGIVMDGFKGVLLHNFWLDIVILFTIWALIQFVAATVRFKLHIKHIVSSYFLDFIAVLYLVIGVLSVYFIDKAVNPFELLGVNSTQVGIVFSEAGVLKYYLCLYGLLVALFWFLDRFKRKCFINLIVRVFLHVSLLGFAVFLFVLTRREMLFVLLLMYVFYLRDFNFTLSIVFGFFLLVLVIIITYVTFVFRGVELESFVDFFRSQEFMPVQFGMVLIDRWVDEPYIDNLLRVFPLSFIAIDTEFTSLNKYYLETVFMFGSFGPTISFFPIFITYGLFVPLLYFLVHVVLMRFVEVNLSRGVPYSLLFCFLSIRILLFIRNGEMVNSLIELTFFMVFVSPFLFCKWKR